MGGEDESSVRVSVMAEEQAAKRAGSLEEGRRGARRHDWGDLGA